MKFESLQELREHLEGKQVFQNQIKGKRLRKELQALQQLDCDLFKFVFFEVSDVAILMHISVPVDSKNIDLAMRLDFEYPFSPPQIFYTGSEYPHLSYCKDLLNIILKDQQWGPSFTLPTFLQKIDFVAKAIVKRAEIPPKYHRQFEYGRQQLEKYGIKLMEGEQYEWKYMIKIAKKKVIGLADDAFLVFDKLSEGTYRLTDWQAVSDYTEVKADRGKNKFQLNLTFIQNQKTVKTYFGGDTENLDRILEVLNPIEMTQRKIQKMEKAGISDPDEAIRLYTLLIEHYSVTQPELMDKYVKAMKKVIEEQYEKKENVQHHKGMIEIET